MDLWPDRRGISSENSNMNTDINENDRFNETKKQLILITKSVDISDDDSLTQFRKNILDWIEKFQIFALDLLWQYYKENRLSTSLLSEILELVGIASLDNLAPIRINLLKCIFKSENLEIRYGVVEGISNLNPQLAIPILEEFLIKENSSMVLKKTISSYIEQLKSLWQGDVS